MTRFEAIGFLAEGTRTGKLATASPSAEPHVAPIWFVLVEQALVFTTGRDSIKGRHLRANPRAALTVDEEQFPYSFVLVRGPVEVVERPADMVAWTTRIAERYVPAGKAHEYGELNAQGDQLLCHLHMEHLTGVRDIAAA
ncbi:PPOX class F420-dependent oxidoreductase [Planosporangium flavigriseum]|uniref:PPOX class F420-dependent enzyme n=1 Tax=Planosporangium flavigriseum TaxID=373681 RepID=A0A8J3LP52_9ACTN|nr:PPOX class F420-dependent oxidoreductase [Planosporangium flavigriseum]NJC66797.1 PPOX class F420-dependent oxidoreductase [Planosporangium flavigriseum]GIG76287.1 PPOX class F420-dependent enzyme [Planosporangium flavigriseum]